VTEEELRVHSQTGWRQVVRRWSGHLAAVLIGLLICVLMLETALRVCPRLFGHKLRNLAFSKYDTLPDGFYFSDRHSGMMHMKRSFETRAFYNGFWWRHRTDRHGFRNPPHVRPKEVLLLGDSMIYGHGVDEEQTVSHFLRDLYGYSAYNMSQQGACLYDHYVLLRLYLSELHPKTVLLFVFLNDFRDTENRRWAYLGKRPEVHEYDYAKIRSSIELSGSIGPSLLGQALFKLSSIRLIAKIHREKQNREIRRTQRQTRSTAMILQPGMSIRAASPAVPAERKRAGARRCAWLPPFVPMINDPERFQRVASYYDAILADLKRRCDEQQVRLVLINLDLPKPGMDEQYYRAQVVVRKLLHDIGRRHQIEVIGTGSAFSQCAEECYLARDVHFSEQGHRVLAELIHTQVFGGPGPAGS
jgi:hypothetical protein